MKDGSTGKQKPPAPQQEAGGSKIFESGRCKTNQPRKGREMTTETKKEIKEIVVVHTTQHVTRRGYLTGYYNYWVAAGQNPRGPLGGRNGNVVDGDFVSDRFYKREKAVAFAKKYAEENDAIFDDEPRKIKSKTK